MKRKLTRYLAPLGLVLAAAALTYPLTSYFEGSAPLTFFLVAVILAAAYGGTRSGIVATALGLLAAAVLFRGRIVLPLAQSAFPLFGVVGVAISVIVGKLYRKNRELREAQQRLELANDALTRHTEALAHANSDLQRFAHALAHDLRNPLRGIRTFNELLMERSAGKLDATSLHCARTIDESARRMEALIGGLLDYATAIEAEARNPVDCALVVRHVLRDLQHGIQSSGARVEVGPMPWLRVNEASLTQLFANLIGNALKYRGPMPPRIGVSAAERGSEWFFTVRDNGIGFDMEHRDEIFEMLKRLHGEATYEGSGIGLALCKSVVERHGGRIWAESAPGQGSAFHFTLPATLVEFRAGTPSLSGNAQA